MKLFLKETNSETGKEVTPLMDNSGEFVVPGTEEDLSMAERQVEQMACVANQKRTALGLPNLVGDDNRSAMALNQQVLDDVGVILMVAAKSRNLKGTFQRALKDAATSIKTVVEVLHERSVNEETAKLQAEDTCLRSEIEELRKELSEIRLEVARINKTPAPPTPRVRGDKESEELISSIMRQVGHMMNARLEALEERLLPEKRVRPPLAADVRRDVVNDTDILRRKSDTITKAEKYAVKTRIGNKRKFRRWKYKEETEREREKGEQQKWQLTSQQNNALDLLSPRKKDGPQ
ncbi:unnamed protein product [Parnassius apollo]|uniref:(apollo) hypothetical protein n=1 Tax=Parnassius apollo TaxID=110799 RepID=A0A8S3XXE4_PARAO|nr:unnamed protein product [Parnassius apollo]